MKTVISIKINQGLVLTFTLLALALMTMFSSCKKSSEKTGEKILETAIGNNTDVDMDDEKIVVETDEGTFTSDATVRTWPNEIPNDVPEFEFGKIVNLSTMESDESTNWTFVFEEVANTVLDEYKAVLKSKGYKVSCISMPGGQGQITAEKGNIFVSVMAGDDMASLSVGIEK